MASSDETPADDQQIDLSPNEVAERHAAGEVELIDVRTDEEWETARLAGSRRIELDRLSFEAETIPKKRPVVFVCRGGSRSAMAAQAFRTAGYDAYNMDGGLVAWSEQGLPLEPDGATLERGET